MIELGISEYITCGFGAMAFGFLMHVWWNVLQKEKIKQWLNKHEDIGALDYHVKGLVIDVMEGTQIQADCTKIERDVKKIREEYK